MVVLVIALLGLLAINSPFRFIINKTEGTRLNLGPCSSTSVISWENIYCK